MQHHKSDKDFVLYLWKFLAVLGRANAYFIHMIAIIFHPVTFWWYSLTHGTRFKDSRAKRKTLHGIIIQFNRYTWQDNNICINPNQNTSNLVQIKKTSNAYRNEHFIEPMGGLLLFLTLIHFYNVNQYYGIKMQLVPNKLTKQYEWK